MLSTELCSPIDRQRICRVILLPRFVATIAKNIVDREKLSGHLEFSLNSKSARVFSTLTDPVKYATFHKPKGST